MMGVPDLKELALVHYGHAVPEGLGLPQVVSDEQGDRSLLRTARLDERPADRTRSGVDPRHRLVEEQNREPPGERSGERDTLHLATGERAWARSAKCPEAEPLHHVAHRAGCRVAVGDVGLDIEVGEESSRLAHEGGVRHCSRGRRGQSTHPPPEAADLAGGDRRARERVAA